MIGPLQHLLAVRRCSAECLLRHIGKHRAGPAADRLGSHLPAADTPRCQVQIGARWRTRTRVLDPLHAPGPYPLLAVCAGRGHDVVANLGPDRDWATGRPAGFLKTRDLKLSSLDLYDPVL